jgi:hypothetical protein
MLIFSRRVPAEASPGARLLGDLAGFTDLLRRVRMVGDSRFAGVAIADQHRRAVADTMTDLWTKNRALGRKRSPPRSIDPLTRCQPA